MRPKLQRFLTFPPVGLSPTEHVCLLWTHWSANIRSEEFWRLLWRGGSNEPGPPMTWRTFLRAHWPALLAADFFTTEVLKVRGLVTYYTVV
jgi:hypothetical protein